MKISELIEKLSQLMETEGDNEIVVDDPHSEMWGEISDVVGKDYTQRCEIYNAYILIKD